MPYRTRLPHRSFFIAFLVVSTWLCCAQSAFAFAFPPLPTAPGQGDCGRWRDAAESALFDWHRAADRRCDRLYFGTNSGKWEACYLQASREADQFSKQTSGFYDQCSEREAYIEYAQEQSQKASESSAGESSHYETGSVASELMDVGAKTLHSSKAVPSSIDTAAQVMGAATTMSDVTNGLKAFHNVVTAITHPGSLSRAKQLQTVDFLAGSMEQTQTPVSGLMTAVATSLVEKIDGNAMSQLQSAMQQFDAVNASDELSSDTANIETTYQGEVASNLSDLLSSGGSQNTSAVLDEVVAEIRAVQAATSPKMAVQREGQGRREAAQRRVQGQPQRIVTGQSELPSGTRRSGTDRCIKIAQQTADNAAKQIYEGTPGSEMNTSQIIAQLSRMKAACGIR